MKKLALLLLLAGCASSYQPFDGDFGYTERQIDADTYVVRFFGNGFTDKSMAYDFAMLRAAELAQAAGFAYFAVTDWRDLSEHAISNSPARARKTLYGTTEIDGGDARLITFPGYELRVEFSLKAGPETFEAQDVQRTVRDGYELQ